MKTMMRRAAATVIQVGSVMVLLLWFHSCIVSEKVHPLQGGFLRRKYRKDRRSSLPIESPFVFYPRLLADFIYKHFKVAQLAWRLHRFQKRLERDPEARNYSDVALTPDHDDGPDVLERLTRHPPPQPAGGQ